MFHSALKVKVTHAGACGSKNVGTSNRKEGEIPSAERIRFLFATLIDG